MLSWNLIVPLVKSNVIVSLFLYVWARLIIGTASATERELIRDNRFQAGFILWKTKPGQHVSYGELKGFDTNVAPAWGLSQWSSKFPLDPSTIVRSQDSMICSNAAKAIALTKNAALAMAVNTQPEYGPKARSASDPWVHLLVEQEFDPAAPLEKIASAKLHVEARLERSRNLHHGDYTPDVHAAQFQIFFTVQNRNHQSSGYGDLLWFGIPIYDNRDRFPKAFKAQDFGGTAKFIYTAGGETFTSQSAHDHRWITIDKDLLPLMREALKAAWARGFLKGSKSLTDYSIGGMNMGWELPGTFDVEMQVRALSLKTNP
jgi:hypothetical protein